MRNLVYEVRYSKEGIKKQVEDAVERIFLKAFKHILRFMGKAMLIFEYNKLFDLAH